MPNTQASLAGKATSLTGKVAYPARPEAASVTGAEIVADDGFIA